MNAYLASAKPVKPVSHQLTLSLCWLFAVLYGVWLLPHTVFTRNVCLIAGALLSLLVIMPRWHLLLKKEAIPIWLIALLFLWVTFHLFFIGQEHATQLSEYTKSWKKIAISSVFAIGLGFAIASNFKDAARSQMYWRIIYFGLMLPVLIYFIKLAVTTWAPYFGMAPSPHLIISREIFTDPFAVHRSGYVFFVMPALAIAIAQLARSLGKKINFFASNLVYIVALIATFLLFFIENDRLAYVFMLLLILIALFPAARSFVNKASTIKVIIFSVIVLLVLGLISVAVNRQNAQWNIFLADAKIAIQVDRYDNWKYTPEYLPLNELGKKVSDSNYKRIAWLIVGSRLALENPMGYGLMSQSFGRIGKLKWPDSQMSWAHSAWLDFALGYGLPGMILLLVSALIARNNTYLINDPWGLISYWGLGSLILVFLVKEVSAEIYINVLIFLILLSSSLSLGFIANNSQKISK